MDYFWKPSSLAHNYEDEGHREVLPLIFWGLRFTPQSETDRKYCFAILSIG
jgi:hypothetical protein